VRAQKERRYHVRKISAFRFIVASGPWLFLICAGMLPCACIRDESAAMPESKERATLVITTHVYTGNDEDVGALSELLAQPKSAPGDVELLREASRFLGRVFGYLEGPRVDSFQSEELQRHKQRVLARLAGSGNEAFVQGFAETAKPSPKARWRLDR
jgi:hypothetical protein